MGNAESGYHDGENEYDDPLDKFDGIETLGYRVLGVQPNSPASKAGLVSFFDFLVGANETMLLGSGEDLEEGDEYDDVDFPALLQEFKGKPLELLVWNIKSQQKRLVTIVPNTDWGGTGLLGVTIRLDNYGGADERLIRVLEMENSKSPASIAGLVPERDYLLGTTTESFDNTTVLSNVLQRNIDRVIELYVYNVDSDIVRIVALMPTYSWGGRGLLGAEVGTGYLHKLPITCRSTNGSSVERKVKWTQPQQQQEQHHQHQTAGEGDDTRRNHSVNHTNGETIPTMVPADNGNGELRLEPQLEMEPEPEQEVEGEENHSDHQQQPNQCHSQQQNIPQQRLVSPEMVATVQQQQQIQKLVEDIPTATSPVETQQQKAFPSAAALFAGPPPGESTSTQPSSPPAAAVSQPTNLQQQTFAASGNLPPPPAAPAGVGFLSPSPMQRHSQQHQPPQPQGHLPPPPQGYMGSTAYYNAPPHPQQQQQS